MNTAIAKKVCMALLVLIVATTMASCDLTTPVDAGSSVEVVMGGIDGARGIGGDVTWVSIKVVNSSGVQKGSGDLAYTGGKWHGKITVSETGLMTFTAIAGSAASQVAWIGKNTLNVTGNGLLLTVVVSTPTSDGSGYGPAGGKVFYDKGSYGTDSWRYLEAAPSDQSTGIGIFWWNGTYITTGATATGTGSGSVNTATIVTKQGAGKYAASLCADLVLGGYDDWFLPSKDELNAMYGKNTAIGGFTFTWYWSSSEYSNNVARIQYFSDGFQVGGSKNTYTGGVRAVRAF